MTAFAYIGAALAEIAGCFAFWAWLRLDKPVWWIAPGMASLALFAAALAGGALLCGADEAAAAALRAAGLRLGVAYQLLDDVADGPEEDGAYREAGRFTAYSLFGPEQAGARAEALLAETARDLDRFGPAAKPLRDLLAQMRNR